MVQSLAKYNESCLSKFYLSILQSGHQHFPNTMQHEPHCNAAMYSQSVFIPI